MMTVIPTKFAHVIASPPCAVNEAITSVAIGDKRLPMRTRPIATAIMPITVLVMLKEAIQMKHCCTIYIYRCNNIDI